MIEIAVVGAHLSGMALNAELCAHGAEFRRAVTTAPLYRLHALAGGPPRRPGLLCIGTLILADGSAPKGFLVEPVGLEGAEDITRFGGWRAFMARV